uniref:Exocyst complex component Sec8 n=1 Tax=Tetradesmus obliquus TaxID=3088 RepID=A0A383V4Z3_TETOB|eukprot:jgi/Sobl393_1/4570/SZX59456.1
MAGSPGLVNWKIVAAELDRVPQDFKDPKFYALKHVVEILTSSNPQGMVGQLRDQEQRLVTLVDQMVQGYHSGFAKSIQNYSQILQLFGDAKEQVDGLKKALADASRQLSAQSRTLQQQWRKTLALECSLGLLDDIQLVADAPGRIDEALAAKDWSAAVQLLLEACSKLATEELAKVGALRKLRQDMLAISLAIQVQLLEELHSKVYASSSTALQQQQQQQQYNSKAVQPYSPHQQRSQTPPRGMNSPRGPGSPLRSMSSPRGSPRVPGSPGVNFPGSAAGQSVMDELKAQQQRGLSRLSAAAGGSSPNLSASVMPAFVVEALQDAPSSSSSRQQQHDQQQQQQQQGPRAANVAELVGCLQQLDALEDAKVYLLLQARAGIRRMVLEVVEAWAAQEEAQQQQQQQGAAGKGWSGRAVMMPHTHAFGTATAAGSIGSSSSKQSWAVQQSVQLSAQRLLSAVFDACLRALSNLGGLLHDIAEASSSSSGGSSRDSRKSRLSKPAAAAAAAAGSVQPPAAGGLKLLKQQLQQQGGGGTSLLAAAGGSSSNLAAEYAAAAAGSSSSIGVHSELLPASSAAAGSFIGGLGGGLNRMINSSGNLLALAGAPGGLAGAAAGGLGAVPGSGVLETKDPVEYLRVQYGHVWNEIQEEALLLLAELLRASLSSGSAAAAPQSGGARQGGWLADFAELGEKARGQLLQATSSTSLAASQVLSSLSSTSSSSALGMGGPAAAAAAGSSGSSVPGMQGFNPGASGALNLAGGFGGSGLGSKLSFSFELTAAELVPALTAGPGAASAAAAAAAAGGGLTSGGGAGSGGGGGAAAAAGVLSVGPGKESVTYAALVKRGLGSGSAGGPYLTPAVFLGVSNFVSDALIVISDASLLALPPPPQQQQQQQQKPAAGAAAAGGSGFGVQHQQAEAQQGLVLSDPRLNSTWLRQSVEEWVVEGFLPQVWVDLRGRCTAALEDPEAFRPQQAAGTTGLLSSSSNAAAAAAGSSEAAVAHRPAAAAAAGAAAAAALPQPPRCVVAAASFAVQVLQEVMAWLPAMPVTAAATLSGVLDAILSQVLEAMTAQAAACLAGTKAGHLALLPQLSLLLATEPGDLQQLNP